MIFLGMCDRSSGIIRGMQIADSYYRGARFIDVRNTSAVNEIANETVVFIRSFDSQTAKYLKSRGCKIVYDLLDRPVADVHESFKRGVPTEVDMRRYSSLEVDTFIVNNTFCRNQLKQFGCQSIVIPHHTINHSDSRNPKDRLKTVGYIGVGDQIMHLDKITDACRKLGLTFMNVNPQTLDECVKCIKEIDIGLIFIDRTEHRDAVMKIKPNTKLSNFQSFGIPTVACRYTSFEEFGENAWVTADSIDQAISGLEMLVTNEELRRHMSDASFATGLKFHIDRVSNLYRQVECKKCNGAGWVWWNELENNAGHDPSQLVVDDTKYACDECSEEID